MLQESGEKPLVPIVSALEDLHCILRRTFDFFSDLGSCERSFCKTMNKRAAVCANAASILFENPKESSSSKLPVAELPFFIEDNTQGNGDAENSFNNDWGVGRKVGQRDLKNRKPLFFYDDNLMIDSFDGEQEASRFFSKNNDSWAGLFRNVSDLAYSPAENDLSDDAVDSDIWRFKDLKLLKQKQARKTDGLLNISERRGDESASSLRVKGEKTIGYGSAPVGTYNRGYRRSYSADQPRMSELFLKSPPRWYDERPSSRPDEDLMENRNFSKNVSSTSELDSWLLSNREKLMKSYRIDSEQPEGEEEGEELSLFPNFSGKTGKIRHRQHQFHEKSGKVTLSTDEKAGKDSAQKNALSVPLRPKSLLPDFFDRSSLEVQKARSVQLKDEAYFDDFDAMRGNKKDAAILRFQSLNQASVPADLEDSSVLEGEARVAVFPKSCRKSSSNLIRRTQASDATLKRGEEAENDVKFDVSDPLLMPWQSLASSGKHLSTTDTSGFTGLEHSSDSAVATNKTPGASHKAGKSAFLMNISSDVFAASSEENEIQFLEQEECFSKLTDTCTVVFDEENSFESEIIARVMHLLVSLQSCNKVFPWIFKDLQSTFKRHSENMEFYSELVQQGGELLSRIVNEKLVFSRLTNKIGRDWCISKQICLRGISRLEKQAKDLEVLLVNRSKLKFNKSSNRQDAIKRLNLKIAQEFYDFINSRKELQSQAHSFERLHLALKVMLFQKYHSFYGFMRFCTIFEKRVFEKFVQNQYRFLDYAGVSQQLLSNTFLYLIQHLLRNNCLVAYNVKGAEHCGSSMRNLVGESTYLGSFPSDGGVMPVCESAVASGALVGERDSSLKREDMMNLGGEEMREFGGESSNLDGYSPRERSSNEDGVFLSESKAKEDVTVGIVRKEGLLALLNDTSAIINSNRAYILKLLFVMKPLLQAFQVYSKAVTKLCLVEFASLNEDPSFLLATQALTSIYNATDTYFREESVDILKVMEKREHQDLKKLQVLKVQLQRITSSSLKQSRCAPETVVKCDTSFDKGEKSYVETMDALERIFSVLMNILESERQRILDILYFFMEFNHHQRTAYLKSFNLLKEARTHLLMQDDSDKALIRCNLLLSAYTSSSMNAVYQIHNSMESLLQYEAEDNEESKFSLDENSPFSRDVFKSFPAAEDSDASSDVNTENYKERDPYRNFSLMLMGGRKQLEVISNLFELLDGISIDFDAFESDIIKQEITSIKFITYAHSRYSSGEFCVRPGDEVNVVIPVGSIWTGTDPRGCWGTFPCGIVYIPRNSVWSLCMLKDKAINRSWLESKSENEGIKLLRYPTVSNSSSMSSHPEDSAVQSDEILVKEVNEEEAAVGGEDEGIQLCTHEEKSGQPSELKKSRTTVAATATSSSAVTLQQQDFFNSKVEVEDEVLQTYSCALAKRILLQGRLYVSKNFLVFSSKFNDSTIFGAETCITIKAADVLTIRKKSFAIIFDNAIELELKDHSKFFMTTFLNREKAFSFISGVLEGNMSPKEEPALGDSLKMEEDKSPNDKGDALQEPMTRQLFEYSRATCMKSYPELDNLLDNNITSFLQQEEILISPLKHHFSGLVINCNVEELFDLLFKVASDVKTNPFLRPLEGLVIGDYEEVTEWTDQPVFPTDEKTPYHFYATRKIFCKIAVKKNPLMNLASRSSGSTQVSQTYYLFVYGRSFFIEARTKLDGVPYSDAFIIVARHRFTSLPCSSSVQYDCEYDVKFVKKVFIQRIIENEVTAELKESLDTIMTAVLKILQLSRCPVEPCVEGSENINTTINSNLNDDVGLLTHSKKEILKAAGSAAVDTQERASFSDSVRQKTAKIEIVFFFVNECLELMKNAWKHLLEDYSDGFRIIVFGVLIALLVFFYYQNLTLRRKVSKWELSSPT